MTSILAPPADFAEAPITNTPLSSSDTTFELKDDAADIGRWPAPSPKAYYAVVWAKTLYASFVEALRAGAAEAVQVTAVDAGLQTLTVTRGQLGTTAIALNASGATYWIRYGISSEIINDIDAGLWSASGALLSHTGDISVSGSATVGGALASGSQTVTGGVTASGNVAATGNVSGANATFTGTLGVTGATTLSSSIAAASEAIGGNSVVKGPTPWIDVTHADYGADPTGVSDSKAAIQAALTAAQSVTTTGGNAAVVFIPRGTYKVSGGLTCTGGVTIVGAGPRGGTEITYTGTDGGDMFTFHDTGPSEVAQWIHLEGLRLVGTGDENSGRCCYFNNCYFVTIERCHVYNFGGGSVTLASRLPALDFYEDTAASTSRSEKITIRDCWVQVNLGGGVRFQGGYQSRICDSQIEQNNKYGVYCEGASGVRLDKVDLSNYGWQINSLTGDMSYPVILNGGEDLRAVDCNFELYGGDATHQGMAIRAGYNGHTQAVDATKKVQLITVRDNTFKAVDYSDCLHLSYFLGAHISGNHFQYNSNTGRYGLVLTTGEQDLAGPNPVTFFGNKWNSSSGASSQFPTANRITNPDYVPIGGVQMLSEGSGPQVYLAGSGIATEVTLSTGDGAAQYPTLSLGGPVVYSGTGVPGISPNNGSLYLRTDGTGTSLYVRKNGAWEQVTSAP